MNGVFVAWAVVAGLLVVAIAWSGRRSQHDNVLAVLLDSTGRFSLNQFQMALWTVVVLSLIAGVALARLFAGEAEALGFDIPQQLLIVMGISLGSGAASTAIKAGKQARNVTIRTAGKPRIAQMVLEEEGTGPETVDVAKFQNFWLTLIVVMAYVAGAVAFIESKETIAALDSLPGFDDSLLVLLGVSHAGYLAGKLPDKK